MGVAQFILIADAFEFFVKPGWNSVEVNLKSLNHCLPLLREVAAFKTSCARLLDGHFGFFQKRPVL